jgi:hypothetical protein
MNIALLIRVFRFPEKSIFVPAFTNPAITFEIGDILNRNTLDLIRKSPRFI